MRLGLTSKFSRFLEQDENPRVNYLGVVGLAVDSKGTVLFLGGSGIAGASGRTENRLMKFSPEGKYLKTLLPYDAKTDPTKLKGIDLVSSEKNNLIPRVYERVSWTVVPAFESISRQTMTITKEDNVVFLNGFCSELFGIKNRRLSVINSDGTIPRKVLAGSSWGKDKVTGGIGHVAVSPDGNTAYITGMWDGRYYPRADKVDNKNHHVVYRADLSNPDKAPEIFFGTLKEAGSDKLHLKDPRGIASDNKGNLYVSDFGNDRVVVLDATGKYVREFAVTKPLAIVANKKNLDIYVVSLVVGGESTLVKFPAGGKSGKSWNHPFIKIRESHRTYYPTMAINWRASEPIIYLGANDIYTSFGVLQVIDKGDSCEVSDFIAKKGFQHWLAMTGVDSDDNVYMKSKPSSGNGVASFAIAGETGVKTKWWSKYYDNILIGRDDNVYQYVADRKRASKKGKLGNSCNFTLQKKDLDKKALPFIGTNEVSDIFLSYWAGRRDGTFVAADGTIHVMAFDETRGGPCSIFKVGKDGKVSDDLVTGLLGPMSVKADRHGNIFIADNLKPAGKLWPKEMDSFIKGLDPMGRREYEEMYGSILKFGKSGTIDRTNKKAKLEDVDVSKGETVMVISGGEQSFKVTGLKDSFVGISPLPPMRYNFRSKCWCLGAMFDMDRHDRLFVPDAARFCVNILDSNFNKIGEFGGYGTIADPGGAANAPGPDVPLECPAEIKVSDKAAYVLDRAPGVARIVRVKLGYAAEATCLVK